MFKVRLSLAFLIFLVTTTLSIGQTFDDDAIQISVLTCAPGNEVETLYGHNAIRVKDNATGSDIVYNWGTFDFNTSGFMIKFMRGKLPYSLSTGEYYRFLEEYNYRQRAVTEQVLSLDSIQKTKVLSAIATNMLPENREYKYDFFMDNCATRIRDIITNNISDVSTKANPSPAKTFRDLIKEYQAKMPWTDFGIDLIIGSRADVLTDDRQQCFLPDYLAEGIGRMHLKTENSIVAKTNNVLSFTKQNNESWSKWLLTPHFFFGLLMALEFLLFFKYRNRLTIPKALRAYDNAWVVVMGIVSIIMFVMWFFTDHVPTKDNYNLLWASPLWLMYPFVKGDKKWIKYAITALTVVSIINVFYQFLPQYFHPVFALLGIISLLKIWRKSTV